MESLYLWIKLFFSSILELLLLELLSSSFVHKQKHVKRSMQKSFYLVLIVLMLRGQCKSLFNLVLIVLMLRGQCKSLLTCPYCSNTLNI